MFVRSRGSLVQSNNGHQWVRHLSGQRGMIFYQWKLLDVWLSWGFRNKTDTYQAVSLLTCALQKEGNLVLWPEFFICYLAVPQPILDHCWLESLPKLMLHLKFCMIFDPKIIIGIWTTVDWNASITWCYSQQFVWFLNPRLQGIPTEVPSPKLNENSRVSYS